jgi:hypothetical protein
MPAGQTRGSLAIYFDRCKFIGAVWQMFKFTLTPVIDPSYLYTDTVGRYCRKHERHPSRVDELLPLSQFQWCIGKGENACRRALAHTSDEAPQGQRSWNRHWSLPQSTALYALWVIQSTDNGGLEISACLDMKNIGKPCAGKPHARFDEGGQARACSLLYPLIHAFPLFLFNSRSRLIFFIVASKRLVG